MPQVADLMLEEAAFWYFYFQSLFLQTGKHFSQPLQVLLDGGGKDDHIIQVPGQTGICNLRTCVPSSAGRFRARYTGQRPFR